MRRLGHGGCVRDAAEPEREKRHRYGRNGRETPDTTAKPGLFGGGVHWDVLSRESRRDCPVEQPQHPTDRVTEQRRDTQLEWVLVLSGAVGAPSSSAARSRSWSSEVGKPVGE